MNNQKLWLAKKTLETYFPSANVTYVSWCATIFPQETVEIVIYYYYRF